MVYAGNVNKRFGCRDLYPSLILISFLVIILSGCASDKNLLGKATVVGLCIDSDGGIDAFKKGICVESEVLVDDLEDQTFFDACTDNISLNEYSCVKNACVSTIISCVGSECIDGSCSTCTDGVQNGDELGIDCGGHCLNMCAPDPISNLFINLKSENVILGESVTFKASWLGGTPAYSFFVSDKPSFENCNNDAKEGCLCFTEGVQDKNASCDYFPTIPGMITWYARVCDETNCSQPSSLHFASSDQNKVFFDSKLNPSNASLTPGELLIGYQPGVNSCEINSCADQTQGYSLLGSIDNSSLSLTALSESSSDRLRGYMIFNFYLNDTNYSSIRLMFKGKLANSVGSNPLKLYVYDYKNFQWYDTNQQINSTTEGIIDSYISPNPLFSKRILSRDGVLTLLAYDSYGDIVKETAVGGGGGSPILRVVNKRGDFSVLPMPIPSNSLLPPLIGALFVITALYLIISKKYARPRPLGFLILLMIILAYPLMVFAINASISKFNVDYVHVIANKVKADSGYLFISECAIPSDTDWVIRGSCLLVDKTLNIPSNKKIIIETLGKLTLDNSNVIFTESTSGSSGIVALSGSDLNINGSTIYSANSGSLIFQTMSGSSVTITDSKLFNMGVPGSDISTSGIWIASEGALLENNLISGAQRGLILSASQNSLLTNNSITSNNDGILILGSSNDTINGNTIEIISPKAAGIFILSAGDLVSRNNMLTNNSITCTANNCSPIIINNSQNNRIDYNLLSCNDLPCIDLSQQSFGNNLLGNSFVLNGKSPSVVSISNSNNNLFSQNRVENQEGLTPDVIFHFTNADNNVLVSNIISSDIDKLSVPYYFKDSNGNQIHRSEIRQDFNVQAESYGWGVNYFISSMLDKDKVHTDPIGSGSIVLSWAIDVLVENESSVPIEGAFVALKNVLNQTYASSFTDNEGKVLGLLGIEYLINPNSSITYNPQKLLVNSEGYMQKEIDINVIEDLNKEVTLQIIPTSNDENPPCKDSDSDGICDIIDNCPLSQNPGQENQDNDKFGDVCDHYPTDPYNDLDADGIGGQDNCPTINNPDQANRDNDQFGDACDPCPDDRYNDIDSDDLCANLDNCPFSYNPSQSDCDDNTIGDACDKVSSCVLDTDGDGVTDNYDNCPEMSNSNQSDQDLDGIGDVCDICIHDRLNDKDKDGICGDLDNCPSILNPKQADNDSDGFGDACDRCILDPNNDIDFDGKCKNVDNCPEKNNPGQADCDNNGVGDACDLESPCAPDDIDGDGVSNSRDDCPENVNPIQTDSDGDGIGDSCDPCPYDRYNDPDMDGYCST